MFPPSFLREIDVLPGTVAFATRVAKAMLRPNGEVWIQTESAGWPSAHGSSAAEH